MQAGGRRQSRAPPSPCLRHDSQWVSLTQDKTSVSPATKLQAIVSVCPHHGRAPCQLGKSSLADSTSQPPCRSTSNDRVTCYPPYTQTYRVTHTQLGQDLTQPKPGPHLTVKDDLEFLILLPPSLALGLGVGVFRTVKHWVVQLIPWLGHTVGSLCQMANVTVTAECVTRLVS